MTESDINEARKQTAVVMVTMTAMLVLLAVVAVVIGQPLWLIIAFIYLALGALYSTGAQLLDPELGQPDDGAFGFWIGLTVVWLPWSVVTIIDSLGDIWRGDPPVVGGIWVDDL